jgi:hypothetical protein
VNLTNNKEIIKEICFFGAGCNIKNNSLNLKNALSSFFKIDKLLILEDTMGAVHATATKSAVVCILGTAPNVVFLLEIKLFKKYPLGDIL